MNISDDISINNIQTNVFNGKLRSNIPICNLDHNKAIACYRDIDNDYGKVCMLDINNNIIISQNEAIFNNGASYWISVDRLTDTKAIVCYNDSGNSDYGRACILDVSNNTITPGSAVVFSSGGSSYISVSRLTNTKAIVCYTDISNNYYGTACILNIKNNTITPGSKVVFNSGVSNNISVNRLTDTKAIVCYRGYNNYRGIACILNIDNDTIILKNSVIFNNKNSNHISVNRLTNNRAIICFRDDDGDNYRSICILNTENNNILNKYQIDNEIIGEIFIKKIDNNHIIICYNTNSNGICEIFKIENDKIISNKYGIIIDYEIENINYVSGVCDNKLNIIYSRIGKLHSQTIELTHEHI